MANTSRLGALLYLALCTLLAGTPALAQTPPLEQVIISAPKPYAVLVGNVERLGGKVKHQYKYIDAVAAEVPTAALPALRTLVGSDALSKDMVIANPGTMSRDRRGPSPNDAEVAVTTRVGQGTQIFPSELPAQSSYKLNHPDLNLRELHRRGKTGENVIVAVIDSGLRPGFDGLYLDGSDIGGENFVPDAGVGRYKNPNNDPHGTFVATLISGNAKFDVSDEAALKTSLNAHLPGVVRDGNSLYLFGTAPKADIFSLRVFSPDEFGAPKSRIIAAMERVIELREMYDNGNRRGVNIQVCNLSLGTSTLHAGRTEIERLANEMLRKGIIPVISAGNVGPSALTTASPASSFAALTVGAASYAANERVFRDFQQGAGLGIYFRPSTHTQTAWFSSRGPNADGHTDPDVMANGFGNVSQGYGGNSRISISNGTSFSAPIVAGLAAILRQAFPRATATEIRNAIVETADASMFGDGSGRLDRGQGIVNAEAAFRLLDSGRASDRLPDPPRPNRLVKNNIEENTNLTVSHAPLATQRFRNLKPGQTGEILFEVTAKTVDVTINLANIRPSLPPEQQNQIYGDDIFVNVHSAKTSSIGAFGDYPYFFFTSEYGNSDLTFSIPNPEPGIMRITLLGDYSNTGNISADVTVTATRDAIPAITAEGTVGHLDLIPIPITIPSGVQAVEFRLEWNGDWGRYPTNDVDLLIMNPNGVVDDASGATLNDPEVVRVTAPMPGVWTFYVLGFAVPSGTDRYQLRIFLDGQVLIRH